MRRPGSRNISSSVKQRDLLNLINRRTWRIRGDNGEWALVDARVTMIPTAETGGREFVVVLRPPDQALTLTPVGQETPVPPIPQ